MIYEELVKALDVKSDENIWLASDIVKLALLCQKRGVPFDGSALLNAFQMALGQEGTLILPTFCFNFSNHGRYDYVKDKGTAGVLGNIALGRADFMRTQHPMHSFAVWGKDQGLLCAMENKHAFGMDSPFEYCRTHHVRQIILGTDYKHAMTFVHYAETMCHVPYRFPKSFTGVYVTKDGKEESRTYDYAARRLEIQPEEKFNRIGAILEEKGIARQIDFCGYLSRSVDLAASYNVICDDILNNQCRNIYDFNVPREEIFANFGQEAS